MTVWIKCRLTCKTARLPAKANSTDAGWDLFAPHSWSIHPGQTSLLPLGISLEIPPGWFVQLVDRSSLAKRGLHVVAGVIDAGYRGVVTAVLHHLGEELISFRAGDRVCQALVLPVPDVEFVDADSLLPSARGTGGFGSTGK